MCIIENNRTLSLFITAITLTLLFTFSPGIAKQNDRVISDELYKKGVLQVEEGDYVGAISSLKESIRLNNLNVNAHESLGWAYFSITKFDQAKIQWQEAINIDPESTAAILGSGYLHYLNGDFDSASKVFKNIIDQYPEYSTAHAVLGRVYAKQGNLDQAIFELQKSINLNPNEKYPHMWLDEIYQTNGVPGKSDEFSKNSSVKNSN